MTSCFLSPDMRRFLLRQPLPPLMFLFLRLEMAARLADSALSDLLAEPHSGPRPVWSRKKSPSLTTTSVSTFTTAKGQR